MTESFPNLDHADTTELVEVQQILGELNRYINLRADAEQHRHVGNISQALAAEKSMQTIYDGLPGWARW